MESLNNYTPTCHLCREDFSSPDSIIKFSCGHAFCINCSPYLIYNIIDTEGITPYFFEFPLEEYPCLICKNGKSSIPFGKFVETYEEIQKRSKEPILCCECKEDPATVYCNQCFHHYYCNKCFKIIHLAGKTLGEHTESNFNQFENNNYSIIYDKNRKCRGCPANLNNEFFCLTCNTAHCDYCKDKETFHAHHSKIKNSEAAKFWKNVDFDKAKEYLLNIEQNFQEMKKKLINDINAQKIKQNNDLDLILEKITKIVLEIKAKNLERSKQECRTVENQLNAIEYSLAVLGNELEGKHTIHPNKLFQICNFFPEYEKEKKYILEDFSLESFNFDRFYEIKNKLYQILSDSEEEKIKLLKFTEGRMSSFQQSFNTLNEQQQKVSVNPQGALLSSTPSLLERDCFSPKWPKSNVVCSFRNKNQEFLAWAGCSYGYFTCSYPLFVHNMNTTTENGRKTVQIMEYNKNVITIVNFFPRKNEAKWLYCGDSNGILTVFDAETFKEIYQKEFPQKKAILNAVFFDDIFREVPDKPQSDYNLSLFVALDDETAPLKLFTYHENFVLLQEFNIPNPANKMCFSTNYFHDEFLQNTCFFFGFSKNYVKSLNLKTLTWESNQFESKDDVTSINFILRIIETPRKNTQRLIIYTHGCNITIADIITTEIFRNLCWEKASLVRDLKIWRMDFEKKVKILLAVCESNSTRFVDFENMNVISWNNNESVSLIYGEHKKSVYSFHGSGKTSQINIHN